MFRSSHNGRFGLLIEIRRGSSSGRYPNLFQTNTDPLGSAMRANLRNKSKVTAQESYNYHAHTHPILLL